MHAANLHSLKQTVIFIELVWFEFKRRVRDKVNVRRVSYPSQKGQGLTAPCGEMRESTKKPKKQHRRPVFTETAKFHLSWAGVRATSLGDVLDLSDLGFNRNFLKRLEQIVTKMAIMWK